MSKAELSNDYYAIKMREWRKRESEKDKNFYKQYLFLIELDGKNFVFRNKKNIKIQKINKKDIPLDAIKQF